MFGLRVLRFFGEALRQSGILIVSSTLVIWGLVFIIGLQCGIEGAYFDRANGAPAYAGVFSAWCDLRELVPYAFGYMMAAKVGTGIVAELGSMRISDEIDALEVMGISGDDVPVRDAAAGGLDGAAVHVPVRDRRRLLRQLLAVVQQIGDVSSGGYFLIFWQFQNPPDLLYSLIKAMAMATVIVLVGCYYGYNASGGPVGVGTATAKSMVLNIVARTSHRNARHAALLGRQPEGTNRRLTWSALARDSRDERDSEAPSGRRQRAASAAASRARPTPPAERADTGSRVSVVDEQPPRPTPPGARRRSTSGTPTRSIRRAARTRSSSSTCTRRSAARGSCAG